MLNFANITNPFNVPRLVRCELINAHTEIDEETLEKTFIGKIAVYGPNGVIWPDKFIISIRDGAPSNVLRVNASATRERDWLKIMSVTLPNTPCTTLHNALNENSTTGDHAGRMKKAEDQLVPTLAIDPLFGVAPV